MQTYKDLWDMAMANFREKISVVAYNTWFQYMKPLDFNGTEFSVSVPSAMTRDVIEHNYLSIMLDSFNETIGISPEINFVIESDSPQVDEKTDESLINFSFRNYVVGDSNSFAFAASRSVAEKYPNITYNPLILYGKSGVGKTHLALAIYNAINSRFPDRKLIYMRTEEFTNEVIRGIHEGRMPEVREKFRSVDVLLLDDIHFIAGKDSVQEEFFNTFNALYQNNKQIIVTCDRPVAEIKTLEDRIKTRLIAGLACDIQSPDYETRVGIIKRNAKASGIDIPDDMVYYIAEQVKQNVRQLEGIVKKLKARSELDNAIINKATVTTAIREIRNGSMPEPVTVQKIIDEVARTYNTTSEELMSKNQSADISKCRHIAIYVVHTIMPDLTLKNVGKQFGKDHSTVHYSLSKVESMMKKEPREREIIEDIINNLQSD